MHCSHCWAPTCREKKKISQQRKRQGCDTDRWAARWRAFAAYADAVQTFDWSGLYNRYYGAAFFEWLRTELEELADVVLIDSRTGVTEMSGVCTRQLADLVVTMCAPNEANLSGMERSVRLLRTVPKHLRGDRNLHIFPVPVRVDLQAETDDQNAWRNQFVDRMGRALGIDAKDYWDLRIPYIPKYSFHEKLVIGDPGGNESLIQAYTDLSQAIAVHFAKSISAGDRRAVLSRIREPDSIVRRLLVTPDADGEVAWNELPPDRHDAAKAPASSSCKGWQERRGVDATVPIATRQLPQDELELARSPLLAGLIVERTSKGSQ